MQKLNVLTDINAVPTGGLINPDSSTNYQITLSATVEKTLTVPAGANRAVFSFFPQSVWVGQGSAPISTPSSSFTNTVAELNPIDRQVTGGGTLRFITSATNAEVGVRFFTDANYYG